MCELLSRGWYVMCVLLSRSIYVMCRYFIGFIVGALLTLLFFLGVLMWYQCRYIVFPMLFQCGS
jgi:hypothetical protein